MYFNVLFALQKYREHLKKTRNDGDELDAVIELIQHTREIVTLVNGKLYFNSSDDLTLHKLNKFYIWMCHWANETKGNSKNFMLKASHWTNWYKTILQQDPSSVQVV